MRHTGASAALQASHHGGIAVCTARYNRLSLTHCRGLARHSCCAPLQRASPLAPLAANMSRGRGEGNWMLCPVCDEPQAPENIEGASRAAAEALAPTACPLLPSTATRLAAVWMVTALLYLQLTATRTFREASCGRQSRPRQQGASQRLAVMAATCSTSSSSCATAAPHANQSRLWRKSRMSSI